MDMLLPKAIWTPMGQSMLLPKSIQTPMGQCVTHLGELWMAMGLRLRLGIGRTHLGRNNPMGVSTAVLHYGVRKL